MKTRIMIQRVSGSLTQHAIITKTNFPKMPLEINVGLAENIKTIFFGSWRTHCLSSEINLGYQIAEFPFRSGVFFFFNENSTFFVVGPALLENSSASEYRS